MATRAIPAGTCNFPVNMKQEERAHLGRTAFPRIQSGEFRGVGDYIRHLVLLGLEAESPAAAEKLKAIRRGLIAAALLGLFLFSVLAGSNEPIRRASVRVRVQREEAV